MASHAAGDREPPPGEPPTVSAASRPKVPPPPTVGPRSEPPTERTAVTRAPRAPADPKELLPTLRMPPIEARAVRRDAEDLAARLGIGKRRAGEADEAAAAVSATAMADTAESRTGPVVVAQPAEPAAPQPSASEPPQPSVDPPTPAARTDARELLPTVPLPTVPVAPSTRERQLHPQARRVPLPLPSVLRAGPRTMGASRSPRSTDAAASERSYPAAGTPEPMPLIDTATLVAACTEQLLELEPHRAESSAPTGHDDPLGRVASVGVPAAPPVVDDAVEFPPPVVAFAAVEHASVETAALHQAPPRRWGWIAATAAVLALTVAGIASLGWSSDAREHKPAAPSEATLSVAEPAGDRVVESPREPLADRAQPVTATAPLLARGPEPIAPAEPEPPVPPEAPLADPTIIVDDAPPLGAQLAPVAPPPPLAAATPAAAAPTAVASPPPSPASAKPSSRARKSSSARASHEAKPASRPPPPSPAKVASAAPTPAAGKPDAAALLREAEAAYGKGNWGAAMRAAQRSQSLRTDGKALRIVAMAACKLQRQDSAQNAFDRLPIAMRKSVRTTCRDAGVKLRL